MMKKQMTLAIALTAMASSAFAEDNVVSNAELTPAQKMEVAIQATSPRMKAATVTPDHTAEAFQARFGDDYTPVVFQTKLFFTNAAGDTLHDPQGTFFVKEGKVTRGVDAYLDLTLGQGESESWPSLSLPEGVEKRGDLYVVSDPTCGYCQKVDAEAERYLASGIQVHYIPYPRAGIAQPENPGFSRWAAATCSSDAGHAYTEISQGNLSKYRAPTDLNAPCTDIIRKGYAFGRKIGVTGTPFMYAKSVTGETFVQPGYVPAEQLGPNIGVLIKKDQADVLPGL